MEKMIILILKWTRYTIFNKKIYTAETTNSDIEIWGSGNAKKRISLRQ